MSVKDEFFDFLKSVKVGIHETSSITKVPTRKLRYWQDKGFISPVDESSSVRQYDLLSIKKIILIQDMLDDGYTLEAASKKVQSRMQKFNDIFDLIVKK